MPKLTNNHTNYLVVLLLCVALLTHCKKDKGYIPYVYVDEYIYTTDPAFSPLNVVSGYIYWRGGSKGLIIFRKTIDEFIAYDRHCTFEVDKNNQTSVDASGIIASDAACGSKFFLTDGSVNSGSASRPLKQYQVTFDGTVLHIFN